MRTGSVGCLVGAAAWEEWAERVADAAAAAAHWVEGWAVGEAAAARSDRAVW